jgi:formylglycine-generating enzyme required for sulfatase activity
MLPEQRKASIALSWMHLCSTRHGILLIIIAVLTMAGGSAACTNAANHAGKVFKDCKMCLEIVVIPPGTFTIGSPETEKDRNADEGQHTVAIGYSFAASKAPITRDR